MCVLFKVSDLTKYVHLYAKYCGVVHFSKHFGESNGLIMIIIKSL